MRKNEFLWRFTVLDFKKQFLEKKEAREYNEYAHVLNASLKAQVDAEKEDMDLLQYSSDDLNLLRF